jgi:hypothetical protein
MKEFLNKNLVSLIVLALVVILYLQRCTTGDPVVPKNTHDTVIIVYHHYHDSTIISKPTIVNHISATEHDIPPTTAPDTNYSRLVAQYDSLRQLYYSKNIAKDSLKMDSTGIVYTTDTTQRNVIIGRRWTYHLDIPEKVTTITNTIYPQPKFQMYVGLGVMGEQEKLVNGAELSALLKNRKDQIFGLSVQKQIGLPLEYTISSYWKLKFHKGP